MHMDKHNLPHAATMDEVRGLYSFLEAELKDNGADNDEELLTGLSGLRICDKSLAFLLNSTGLCSETGGAGGGGGGLLMT